MLIQLHENQNLIERVLGILKNGCGQSDHGTLKSTLFEELTDGISCVRADL